MCKQRHKGFAKLRYHLKGHSCHLNSLSSEAGRSSRPGGADSSSALHKLFATTPALGRASHRNTRQGEARAAQGCALVQRERRPPGREQFVSLEPGDSTACWDGSSGW